MPTLVSHKIALDPTEAQRTYFRRAACGYETGRDLNAAQNLERIAGATSVLACGEERADGGRGKPLPVKRTSVKQELEQTPLSAYGS